MPDNKYTNIFSRMRHSAWMSDMTSGFIATTLGIIITLGTGILADRMDKKQKAKSLTIMVLKEMKTIANQYEARAETMLSEDSVMQYVYDLYPDSIESVDPDKAKEFANILGRYQVRAGNTKTTETMFNNIMTWESINDKEFISAVGSYFSMIQKMDAILDDLENKRLELYLYSSTSDEFINEIGSAVEWTVSLLKNQEVRVYIQKHNMMTQYIEAYANVTNQVVDNYMQKNGLKETDLFHPEETLDVKYSKEN